MQILEGENGKKLLPDAGTAAGIGGRGGDGEKEGQADAEKEQVGTRFGCFVRCVDVVQTYRKVLRPIGGSAGMPLLICSTDVRRTSDRAKLFTPYRGGK